MGGFDIIGDVHGCADKLTGLLESLEYRKDGGVYTHSERKAIYVGDLIDRGPQQVETIEIVRAMGRFSQGDHGQSRVQCHLLRLRQAVGGQGAPFLNRASMLPDH